MSHRFPAVHRSLAKPVQRAYLKALARRLFARRLLGRMGAGDFHHAVAVRTAPPRRTVRPR